MSVTWRSADEPAMPPVTALGWLRVAWRGAALGGVVFGGLAVLLLLRLAERPIWGQHRPWTPHVTQGVCRAALAILRLPVRIEGSLMQQPGAVVANHSSWLDIFVLNAPKRIYFVSKSEVAGWPAIGWLARATGTVFIQREKRQARQQQALIEARLHDGHKLLFFPEGTSTDGQRVLPFKSTLFSAFYADGLADRLHVQPVTVRYTAPPGEDPRFYGWWGDMGFGPHLLKVLAARRQGRVSLRYHPPLAVADYPDRKALALACEAAVRAGFDSPAG